jgi:hypothetical protein
LAPALVTCCCAPGMTALLPLPVRTSGYFLINLQMKRLKTHPHSLSTLTTPSSLGDVDLDSENKQKSRERIQKDRQRRRFLQQR